MEKVILQLWEESSNGDIQPDGCSLHIDNKSHNEFTSDLYLSRICKDLPESFERAIGNPIEVSVTKEIFEILKKNQSVRIQQYEMNNLLNLNEIIADDL